MNNRPIEEQNSRGGTLGKCVKGSTIPSSCHSRVRNQEDQKCGHSREGKWEEDVACRQDTEKIECRVRRERVEVDGNVEVFELRSERAAVTARVD